MRSWIKGSLATLLISGGAWAAPDSRDLDTPRPQATSGKRMAAKPKPTEAASDFPPPIDAPISAVSEDAGPYSRPVQAKPAVLSSTMQPPGSMAVMTPPSSPISSLTSELPPVNGQSCAAGCPTMDWPAPQGRINGRVYGSADYLLLWARKGVNPPLVQSISPENAVNALNNGTEFPTDATTDVFGGDGTDPGPFSGVRGTLGLWLDSCYECGVELGYIQLFRDSDRFSITSNGIPVIGRNFFDVAAQRNAFLFYSNPNGSQRGFINIDAPTQAQGGEFNVRYHTLSILADRTEVLAGFRYFNLREALGISSGADFVNPAGQVTSHYDSFELFRTRNDFYGGQIGIDQHFYRGCWTVDFSSKIAFGNVHQNVLIDGGTTLTQPGVPVQNFPAQSLLFVQPTNIGIYNRDRFSVMPEFSVKIGYQVTQKMRATLGYEFIMITDAVRPGTAIDRGVNPNNTQFIVARQPSDALNPRFSFNDSDWWAQGLTAGIAFNY